ncbi:MAG: fumarylacetoacetase [Armatimonadetes bacterium]|nr:fumarylacetoacetase [Armatimonadota bacterium]
MIPAKATTWAPVPANSDFPIQNLPFGVVVHEDEQRVVTRIGDQILELAALAEEGFLPGDPVDYLDIETIIGEEGGDGLSRLRKMLYDLLRTDNPNLRDNSAAKAKCFHPAQDAPLNLPLMIDAYVDFYSGINHASNVGKMFRPDMAPLLPNYRHLPVGYNGRASSVIPSGVPVKRPCGQTKAADADMPTFGPTKELDFELEMGFFVGAQSEMGEAIPIDEIEDYILGFVMVNDWSARDVQRWEYQPLGPFLAKSFATSISPWLITLDALEPFRIAGLTQDPPVLPHLRSPKPGHYDIQLEVSIQTPRMTKPQVISRTNTKELYWTAYQQLTHQSSNGTPLEVGDLYASGTISGSEKGTFGSLLELSWRGTEPIKLTETGETRTFLQDGDVVTFRGWAQGEGFRVGFGELTTEILPA